MTSNTSDISVMSSDLSSHCQQIVVNQINDKIKNYESLLKNCNNEFSEIQSKFNELKSVHDSKELTLESSGIEKAMESREVSDSHDSDSEPKTDLELLLKAENYY